MIAWGLVYLAALALILLFMRGAAMLGGGEQHEP